MEHAASERQLRLSRITLTIGLIALGVGALILLFRPETDQQFRSAIQCNINVLILAVPAFLAGILSFLSPCTLPILPAYFAFTFGAAGNPTGQAVPRNRARIILASLAFFAGLATTLIIFTASFTIIGRFFSLNRDGLVHIGGILIIGFGVMSLFGKGFSGLNIRRRSSTTLAGAYLYGFTFALGWTACIGPILGMILTLLASQGGSLITGIILALIYAMGLGLPLMLVATFFGRMGQGSRAWRLLRGRGWEMQLGSRTLYFHSTNIISGILLIGVGVLLFNGTLSSLNQYAAVGPGQYVYVFEDQISRFFGLSAC